MPVRVDAPFATVEYVAKRLGVSARRVKRLRALLREPVDHSNGAKRRGSPKPALNGNKARSHERANASAKPSKNASHARKQKSAKKAR